MLTIRKILRTVFMAGIILTIAGCGGSNGGGGTTQFDEQDLNDNATTIQANVNAANLIFVGTIKQIGTAPGMWSGPAEMGQIVTYTIGAADQILKDTNSVATAGADINIMHLVIDENRQTSSSAALNDTLFAVGSQIIVLASLSDALTAVGSEGWDAYASHTDVDGQFSAIPNTTNNLAAIRAMLSSAGAMIVEKMNDYKGNYTVDKTFNLTGSAADQTAWNNLIDACKGASAEFEALWNLVNTSETEVTFNLGRGQERVFVDSFRRKAVDLDDLEAWRTNGDLLGCNSKSGVCQILSHILMEYYHAATTGEDYVHSHEAALLKENDIREGVPKETIQSGHTWLEKDGKGYVVTGFNNGTRELVEVTDGTNPGVGTFTVENIP